MDSPPERHKRPKIMAKVRETTMLDLPQVLLKKVCSFQDGPDAISLSRTCKTMHSHLRLTLLPLPLLRDIDDFDYFEFRRGSEYARIPIVLRKNVHSVHFAFKWGGEDEDSSMFREEDDDDVRDKPDHVWLIAKKNDSQANSEQDFDGGRIVLDFGEPPTRRERKVNWFTPNDDEEYFLWYERHWPHKISYDDDFLRLLDEPPVCYLVHDDVEWNLRTNWCSLVKENYIPKIQDQPMFSEQMLLCAVKCLITQKEGNENDNATVTSLEATLQQHGLTTSSMGLKSIVRILQDVDAVARIPEEDDARLNSDADRRRQARETRLLEWRQSKSPIGRLRYI
ncbi:hypothetical protein MPSEU_000056300 [Mayamaea pseudoterrestris]|nr:hypothetical protein MPSEU_000056300 [Mayamaea pseudoterrestris]